MDETKEDEEQEKHSMLFLQSFMYVFMYIKLALILEYFRLSASKSSLNGFSFLLFLLSYTTSVLQKSEHHPTLEFLFFSIRVQRFNNKTSNHLMLQNTPLKYFTQTYWITDFSNLTAVKKLHVFISEFTANKKRKHTKKINNQPFNLIEKKCTVKIVWIVVSQIFHYVIVD